MVTADELFVSMKLVVVIEVVTGSDPIVGVALLGGIGFSIRFKTILGLTLDDVFELAIVIELIVGIELAFVAELIIGLEVIIGVKFVFGVSSIYS